LLCYFFLFGLGDYQSAIKTHCGNWQWFPSISSAISTAPGRYVWRFGIGIYSCPKLLVDVIQFIVFQKKLNLIKYSHNNRYYRYLNILVVLLAVAEDLALYGLTYISSIENHFVHSRLFGFFMLFAHVHFLLFQVLFYLAYKPLDLKRRSIFKWRNMFAITHTLTFVIAAYLFVRHNLYCENGVFSLFALLECFIVFNNIGFHSLTISDWKDVTYTLVEPDSSNVNKV